MDALASSSDNDVFIQKSNESAENPDGKEKNLRKSQSKKRRRASTNSHNQNSKTEYKTASKRLSSVPQPLQQTDTLALSKDVESFDESDDYRDHVAQHLEKLNMKEDVVENDEEDDKNKNAAIASEQADIDHDEQLIMGTGATVKATPLTAEKNQKKIILERKLTREDEINVMGTLDLSSLNIMDNDISRIFDQIFCEGRRKCTRLVLRDNSLTSHGVKILVDKLLQKSPDLKYLGLSGNKSIGDSGLAHLIRLLRVNRSITLLALHNTGITDDGVQMLADLLCTDPNANPSGTILQKLYMPFNRHITDKSLIILRQIIENSPTLNVLTVQNCGLSNIARKRLKEVAKKRRNLRLSV